MKTRELRDEFGAILWTEKQEISGLPLKDLIEHQEIREHKNGVTADGILII